MNQMLVEVFQISLDTPYMDTFGLKNYGFGLVGLEPRAGQMSDRDNKYRKRPKYRHTNTL